MDIPTVPMIFTKHTTCLVGPNATIEMRSDHVDYEAELVVVIGQSGKDIHKDKSWDHVAGLCVGQDISDRTVQFSSKPPQFNLGKSFDTFGPMGPYLISPDLLEDKESLEIECKVNEEIRQKDNTNDLIFNIPSIISYLSEIVTLNTGDVIFTGTPGGVGVMEGKFLKEGDVLRTNIAGPFRLGSDSSSGSLQPRPSNVVAANAHDGSSSSQSSSSSELSFLSWILVITASLSPLRRIISFSASQSIISSIICSRTFFLICLARSVCSKNCDIESLSVNPPLAIDERTCERRASPKRDSIFSGNPKM